MGIRLRRSSSLQYTGEAQLGSPESSLSPVVIEGEARYCDAF
jgi:hypothetical protein